MKDLPLGLQSFRKIIRGGCVYVDKTQYVHELIRRDGCYFLSRPRRFGKSLLLDTIKEAFSGDKELFKGLFLYDSGYAFEKHPVLRLDMSDISNQTPEKLEKALVETLQNHAEKEGISISSEIPSNLFKFLIERLFDKYGKEVVVLIDEYDKPILDRIGDTEVAEANRDFLRGFYGVLKSMDPFLRLTFITGVTKFTKTSVFSGLNNLTDITLSKKYSGICGIPVEELDRYFDDRIKVLESDKAFSRYDSVCGEILAWYDGYSWDGVTRVINPHSLLSFFDQSEFRCFWFATGTPSFLMDLIKKRPEGYADLTSFEIGEFAMDTYDIERISVEPLLFQSGYLTVKEILDDKRYPTYLLEIPNHEVMEAFNMHILATFTESEPKAVENAYRRIEKSLKSGDLQDMLLALRSIFASIPYQIHINREAYYHSIFCSIINLFGFRLEAESQTARGRIDASLEYGDKVYIIEFKYKYCKKDAAADEKQALFEETLDDAMAQIKDRGYANKYVGSGKSVYLVAIAFLGSDDIEMRVEEA